MSQKQFLENLDADLHAAFADAGMADVGTYTAPGGAAVPNVRAYVDHDLARLGEYAETFGVTCTITILRADLPDPLAGGTFAIDGRTYTLRQPIDSDDGISTWGAA